MRGFVSHVAGRVAHGIARRVARRISGRRAVGAALSPVGTLVTNFLDCRQTTRAIAPGAGYGRPPAGGMVDLARPRWARLLKPVGLGIRRNLVPHGAVPGLDAESGGLRRRRQARRARRKGQGMVAQGFEELAIVHDAEEFSHTDACRIFDEAICQGLRSGVRMVVVDLKRAADATTSTFARLVLLRRILLRQGRDLRLTGLRDRAAGLYEINRLSDVLPCR